MRLTILIGNTMTLRAEAVTNRSTGAYINDATVTATIKTQGGTLIETITLDYVPPSNGNYEGLIPADADILNGKFYVVEVTGNAGGGNKALWHDDQVLARYRGFNE